MRKVAAYKKNPTRVYLEDRGKKTTTGKTNTALKEGYKMAINNFKQPVNKNKNGIT